MTGQGSLNRDLGRLKVTHFTNHHNIGILTEEGAQGVTESHPYRFMHRHLHDSLDVVLHRVFNCQQLGRNIVNLVERRVKRRRLAATGRPRHNHDAVGLADHIPKALIDMLRHPQLVKLQLHGASVQYAKHHRFTKLGRQAGDTQVNRPPVNHHVDTTILGQSALRNIQVGDNLQTRNHRQSQMPGWRSHLIKGAIHTITDFELIFERLKVNVGSTVLNRLLQNQIDELYNRRLIGQVAQVVTAYLQVRLLRFITF